MAPRSSTFSVPLLAVLACGGGPHESAATSSGIDLDDSSTRASEGGSTIADGSDLEGGTTQGEEAGPHDGTRTTSDASADSTASSSGGAGSSSGESSTTGAPDELLEGLLSLASACTWVGGDYASDVGAAEEIPICGLTGAVFWRADMDIDCDGMPTDACNENTDPWFQPQTSMGDHIAAEWLPFVVLPSPSFRFDYGDHDLQLGSVVAVIYDGQVRYGAFVDSGPEQIIGEASYAMAELFGIDPDPAVGGTADEVIYVAFTGEDAVVPSDEILDHDLAEAMGEEQAWALLADN